jgi:adenylylsulfate kinase
MSSASFQVLALSGPVGVGKSAVLAEIHQQLSDAEVPHACVERDALACSWPSHGYFNTDIFLENLRSVVDNFRRAGAGRLVIAGVLESMDDVEGYRAAIPGAQVIVWRLTAPQSVREARLRDREQGSGLEWHLHRTVELEALLSKANIEDYIIDNGDRPLEEVAHEILVRAGWLR